MSEEESNSAAPKKRVVKKGVRGKRAPRKKIIKKEGDEDGGTRQSEPVAQDTPVEKTENAGQAADQQSGGSEPVPAKPSAESTPSQEKPSIAVVEETPIKAVNPESDESKGETSAQGGSDRDHSGRRRSGRGRGRNPNEQQVRDEQPRRRVDLGEAAEKAWEIYQGELEEEGVSLVDGRRGREIARRCLELAVVFCEERDRFLSNRHQGS